MGFGFSMLGGTFPLMFLLVFVMAIYLSLNAGINLISKSKKEKYIMTLLSFVTAICFWITALQNLIC